MWLTIICTTNLHIIQIWGVNIRYLRQFKIVNFGLMKWSNFTEAQRLFQNVCQSLITPACKPQPGSRSADEGVGVDERPNLYSWVWQAGLKLWRQDRQEGWRRGGEKCYG